MRDEPPRLDLWLMQGQTDVRVEPWAQDCMTALGEGEQARARRFDSPARRREFVLGRALLRAALSARLPAFAPRHWQVRIAPSGRPYLAREHRAGPSFALAHTRGLWAVALWHEARIGVDVEPLDRPVSALALARRFFAPSEAHDLERMHADERAVHFLGLWALKEAYRKGAPAPVPPIGVCAFRPPARLPALGRRRRLRMAPGEDGAVTSVFPAPMRDEAKPWRFGLWCTPSGHLVALAAASCGGALPSVQVHHIGVRTLCERLSSD